jgi:predicted nuclease of predicted toxin-antitoxin system
LKLLVDENLSRKLVSNLLDLFPGSIHLSQADLLQSPDFVVWEYAKANGFAILSTDADFFELASTLGPPPKVIWLRRWSHSTRDAEHVLRREVLRISAFEIEAELGLLVLDKDSRST